MGFKSSKIEYILEKYSDTRNNDTLLFIKYLQEYHCKNEIEKAIIERILKEAPQQSSIQRSRAWYQNELWLYLPPIETMNKRKIKAMEIKEKIREVKKDKIWFFDAVYRFLKK